MTVAVQFRSASQESGHHRFAAKDPVTAAQLEVIAIALVRRADAAGMIETLEDRKATRSYLINTLKPLLDCKLCETA